MPTSESCARRVSASKIGRYRVTERPEVAQPARVGGVGVGERLLSTTYAWRAGVGGTVGSGTRVTVGLARVS